VKSFRAQKFLILIILGVWLVFAPNLLADEDATGGTQSIFAYPVGAQASALGGAYVAVANDAMALYWNPANLENSTHFNLSLCYTNLLAGAPYNYIAYAHPTLSIGTLAFGVLYTSLGEIPLRDYDSPRLLGYSSYSQTQFMLGYAYRFFDWMSVGVSFKVERLALPPYAEDASGQLLGADSKISPFVENGAGSDLGFLFTPKLNNWFLQDITFGLSIQNALQRSVRAKTERELAPRNFRVGFAKGVPLGEAGTKLLFTFQLDGAEKAPIQSHFGAEYNFRQNAMMRVGYNDGRLTYGVGARFAGVQIDYSYWNGWETMLGSSHRISMTLAFGKSREERLRILEQKQLEEMRREIQQQRDFEARQTITTNLYKARTFFNQGDYPRSYTAAYKVLAYEDSRKDPEIEEARRLLSRIEAKLEEQRQKELEEARIRDEQERRLREKAQRVRDHYNKALAFFQNEDYIEAIAECDRALAEDSTSQQVKDLREKADRDLREKIYDLTTRADRAERRQLYMEAIDLYGQARRLARGLPEYSTYADGRIRALQNKLRFDDLLRRAQGYENDKNFKAAAEMYQRALGFQPNNQTIREKYEFVKARAQARDVPMTPEVEELWKRGTKKALAKQYEEAISYFERALKKQPFNKTLLDALDNARENLQKERSKTNTSE